MRVQADIRAGINDAAKSPMEIMRATAPEDARTYLDHGASIRENPPLETMPTKCMQLVDIVIAAACSRAPAR